jgi:S-adenosyl methyltransferase
MSKAALRAAMAAERARAIPRSAGPSAKVYRVLVGQTGQIPVVFGKSSVYLAQRPRKRNRQMTEETGPTDRSGPPVPNVARIYDALLSGKDNYQCDRDAVEQITAIEPDAASVARDNRAFLGRVVRYLAREQGVRQFLDIGSGLPTASNVHQVAQAIAPHSRVVYVDNDRCKPGCTHAR